MRDDLRNPANGRRDDGSSERHRLEERHRDPFVERRQDKNVHRGDQVVDIGAVANKEARVVHPKVPCQGEQLTLEGTAPDDQEPGVGFLLEDVPDGSEKVRVPLDGRKPARGPDEERARVDTQLSPHVLRGSRRPHRAQIDTVVNMGDRRWSVPGILQGVGHALGDRNDAVSETS